MAFHNFILKGDIIYSESLRSLKTFPAGFLVCENGKSAGVFPRIPDEFTHLPVKDFSGKVIIPGLVDLHCHAPQYAIRALGMDSQLLEWLERRAFPEETKYHDIDYARRAYSLLIAGLKKSPTTRICLFASTHVNSTVLLMNMLEESGLVACVGKVNMDRNAPDTLREKDAETSARATREWLEKFYADSTHFKNIAPILTPRFIPSCSDSLMESLSLIQKEYALPLQSHLSENRKEVAWVRELSPESSCYADSYAHFGLFGGNVPTIMAHCVWPDENELSLIRDRGVYVAHCPQSNQNLASGIAPVRCYLNAGAKVGLGSDLAAGSHISIFHAMMDAIQVSKIRSCLIDQDDAPLSLAEAFYLGTAGGGAFFAEICRGSGPSKSGSFEAGYDFDALVLDDSNLGSPFELSLFERLERLVYLSDDRNINAKYVRGKHLF
ncbi:MAG: amidohydrolase family protein [Spirochaetaceae bacterium]|jgi:guanine deaminase|nr:amidohydrolase family protein [Spirochaetaceae bacterium]